MQHVVQQMHPRPAVSGTAQRGSLNLVVEKLHRSMHQQSATRDDDLDLRLAGNATTTAQLPQREFHTPRIAGVQ